LAAAYGLVQLFVGYGSLDRRIRGPFSHYMTFAGVLLLCNFLLLARMACARRRRFLDWAAVALINGALLGSLTRSSWVATFVALVLLVVLSGRLNLVRALAGAAVLAAVLAPISLVQRVLSIGDPHDLSNYDRLCMVDAGLEMIADRPLFGIGPGLVKEIYPLYRHPTAPRYRVPHLHNTFLQLGAERGLASLTAYLGMMAAAIGLALRRYRAEGGRGGPRADLYLGVVLALVAFNLAGLFEDNWDDSEVQRVALFVMAIPFCLRGSPRGEGGNPSVEEQATAEAYVRHPDSPDAAFDPAAWEGRGAPGE
jgi:O-antigen ligase